MSSEPANTVGSGNTIFAPALLDPDLDIPEGVVGPDGLPAPKRFSVYRNNVVSSLMEAMRETYPSIAALVGEENFQTLSRIFISRHPPSSPMMQSYGGAFPDFLKGFAPLRDSPFLESVAQVEKNWIHAYHAADASPLEPDALGKIDPELLMDTRFNRHPATHIITSDYCLFELFNSRDGGDVSQLNYQPNETPQSILITRPHLSVTTTPLNTAMTAFFSAILNQTSLGESVEVAMQCDPEFDASRAITLLLTSGALSKFE